MNFIVLPMQGAVIKEDFISKSFSIIMGSFEEKVQKLSQILNWNDYEETKSRMNHIKRTSNDDFFTHPLLICETPIEGIIGNKYFVKYINNIMNVIYWGNIFPDNELNIIKYVMSKDYDTTEYRYDMREKNKHFFISFNKDYKRCPVGFEYSFDYELDWVKDNIDIINKFLDIWTDRNKLFLRLKNSMNLFSKAIFLESQQKEEIIYNSFISDSLLFLHTTLECLILKDSDEDNKSLRIRKCVDKNLKDYKINDDYNNMFDFIKYITNIRGRYVHQGTIYAEQNNRDIFNENEKEKLTDFVHFKIIVAKMIIRCMNIVYDIKYDCNISKDKYEEKYFKKLRREKMV
ncbi:HEPN domain-containing protein [Intestinibacter bartlettii]|uniref:HEPN domain-containing protein n=1 Tax=Intestinibacter bartlettii TaxID=261299 RepID=UPI001D101DB7|nr:HEPN domain-containing protein [Intestinibacter bartlettii]MCC2707603.1 hypothetical protein [Intestinibacter bartlettii]MCC2763053.1 hypothetical protein [Intestinibacter bartlettii]